MELSFEYLMSKNCLQWVTIASEQAMLMSVCLQSMVDELLNQKDGNDFNYIQVCIYAIIKNDFKYFLFLIIVKLQNHKVNQPFYSYIRRDDGQDRRISESSSTDTISSLVRHFLNLIFNFVFPFFFKQIIKLKIITE